ncbi:MAG: cytochrome c biogenesis protein CcsA [Verrucomicrobia bacterium]|nr:cytochrome c biogenesis protein CcsA [Verrucomicrobiota bacterium]
MDRLLLACSTLCFLLGFARALFTLGAGRYQTSRFQFTVMLAGFALQSAFLYVRGQEIGRCPLTNIFELLVFLSWATVVFYVVIGPTYRLSLLGAFTAPLAFALQTLAFVAGDTTPTRSTVPINAWLEAHAAFSILAYGAFLLAALAGAMFVIQDRQLKSRQLGASFFQLPPIQALGVANARLLLAGFVLLSIGMLAGFGVGQSPSPYKLGWSIGVWLLYGSVLLLRWRRHLAPRRVALISIGAAGLAMITLSGITFIAEGRPARSAADRVTPWRPA